MTLACQKNSYLKTLTTIVKSCEPGRIVSTKNGKKEKINGFEIILEDTVLFPEGGGQHDDRGTINDLEVYRVTRRGAEAIHFVLSPLAVDTGVVVQLDWTRRFDHMQQHSGQHLITAIAEQNYGYPTTSWYLGDKTSFIELDTPSVTPEQMAELEKTVNDLIRLNLSMSPAWYDDKDDEKLNQVRARGLPDDHVGSIRVVTIDTIDSTMCCGTHVSNLSHLQAVKLLYVEKGKKNKVNLVFVVGQRVLAYLGRCYATEKALSTVLNGAPGQHVDLAEKIIKSSKASQKSTQSLLKEVAILEAQRFKQQPENEPLLITHRKEGDVDFMNALVNEIGDANVTIFVSVGDEKGQGLFILSGTEELIQSLGKQVADILEAKGAGKKGRFQGKATKLSQRPKVEQLLREHLHLQHDS